MKGRASLLPAQRQSHSRGRTVRLMDRRAAKVEESIEVAGHEGEMTKKAFARGESAEEEGGRETGERWKALRREGRRGGGRFHWSHKWYKASTLQHKRAGRGRASASARMGGTEQKLPMPMPPKELQNVPLSR